MFKSSRYLIPFLAFSSCVGCGMFPNRSKSGSIATEVENHSPYKIQVYAHLSQRWNSNNCNDPVRYDHKVLASNENGRVEAKMNCVEVEPSGFSEIEVVYDSSEESLNKSYDPKSLGDAYQNDFKGKATIKLRKSTNDGNHMGERLMLIQSHSSLKAVCDADQCVVESI